MNDRYCTTIEQDFILRNPSILFYFCKNIYTHLLIVKKKVLKILRNQYVSLNTTF